MFDRLTKFLAGRRRRAPATDAVRRAESLRRRGDVDDALDEYRRAVAAAPGDAEACAGLGSLLAEIGRYDDAEPLLRRALAREPTDAIAAHAHRALGTLLQARGDRPGAIGHLAEALARGLVIESAFRDLCLLLVERGETARAREVVERGLEAFPSSADLHAFLGNLESLAGDHGGASECYLRALSIGPPRAEWHFNLGVVLARQGRHEEAIDYYRQALVRNGAFAGAHLNLANALRALGRTREALAHYEQAARIAPDYVDAHKGAAAMHALARDPQRALAGYERARTLAPGDPDVHRAIGTVLLELGRVDEAIGCYGEALRVGPDDVDGLLGLGNALLQHGDTGSAVERYRRVLELEPGHAVAHLVASLTGGGSERAPAPYVAKLFDDYAERFDSHLVSILHYGIPGRIADTLAARAGPMREGWDVLDLGCGTGLVGTAIAPLARRIVGVDLSSGMLAKAAAAGRYERLEQADLVEMMEREPPSSYDVVTAADVFVYLGRLDGIVREAARLLRPGGLFVFSVESLDALAVGAIPDADAPGFRLNATGRYAHSIAYLRGLASAHAFRILDVSDLHGRIEKGKPVDAYLMLWRRPEEAPSVAK